MVLVVTGWIGLCFQTERSHKLFHGHPGFGGTFSNVPIHNFGNYNVDGSEFLFTLILILHHTNRCREILDSRFGQEKDIDWIQLATIPRG